MIFSNLPSADWRKQRIGKREQLNRLDIFHSYFLFPFSVQIYYKKLKDNQLGYLLITISRQSGICF